MHRAGIHAGALRPNTRSSLRSSSAAGSMRCCVERSEVGGLASALLAICSLYGFGRLSRDWKRQSTSCLDVLPTTEPRCASACHDWDGLEGWLLCDVSGLGMTIHGVLSTTVRDCYLIIITTNIAACCTTFARPRLGPRRHVRRPRERWTGDGVLKPDTFPHRVSAVVESDHLSSTGNCLSWGGKHSRAPVSSQYIEH